MTTIRMPQTPLERLAQLGAENLARVIAIDSQSDERSDSIPSTEGQRNMTAHLTAFFSGLGFEAKSDEHANLLVRIPATAGCEEAPALALLVHIDTSRGTEAVTRLEELPAWDGGRIPYPRNDKLQVTTENYPETEVYIGDDLLFGPGEAPIGLDDKLGMAELMTLAQVLSDEPEIPHGQILIVCRPDEEIGRMAAVEGLADDLARRGVKYGYTIDGLAPFEIQVENFHASKGVWRVPGEELDLTIAAAGRILELRIAGCKSHGATAKPEGYLNATVIAARVRRAFAGRADITPIAFQSDLNSEVNADVTYQLRAGGPDSLDATEAELLAELERQIEPHRWKGAQIQVLARVDDVALRRTNAVGRALDLLVSFLSADGPKPILSEESDGRQGYSNPYFLEVADGAARVEFRLRSFDRAELDAREAHVAAIGDTLAGVETTIEQQYVNMGPSLQPYPELVDWARSAAEAVGVEPHIVPIRGGTGVDPFLARDIPIANLGTGYFAPESEKEFTSRQKVAQHAAWLVQLVQRVALEESRGGND